MDRKKVRHISFGASPEFTRHLLSSPGFFPLHRFIEQEYSRDIFSIHTLDDESMHVDTLNLITCIGDIAIHQFKAGYLFATDEIQVRTNLRFDKVEIIKWSNSLDSASFQIMEILLHIFRYRLLLIGGIGIHSAAIAYKGQGIAFCGLSGAGKSTQANLWIKHAGAWPINYDKPALLFDHNKISIIGTPWSGKERCFKNIVFPLKCIVFIVQAPNNCVKRLSSAEAYSRLYPNYMVYPISDVIIDAYEKAIEKLASLVPIYELSCTKEADAVFTLLRALKLEEDRQFMKIREGFVLRNLADEWIVIARGKKALEFSATIILNETGKFLWDKLQNEVSKEQLICSLMNEYGIDRMIAETDVSAYIEQLKEYDVLETVVE